MESLPAPNQAALDIATECAYAMAHTQPIRNRLVDVIGSCFERFKLSMMPQEFGERLAALKAQASRRATRDFRGSVEHTVWSMSDKEIERLADLTVDFLFDVIDAATRRDVEEEMQTKRKQSRVHSRKAAPSAQ